jgi:valyl-tRNA synthetase
MSQVETILNMLKPLIPKLSAEEKSQLFEELKKLLDTRESSPEAGQNQSNTVSGVSFDGGGNNALNFSPVQNSGGEVEVSPNFSQTTSSNKDTEELLQALQDLKQGISEDSNLDALTKNGAQQEAEKLEQEVQKSQPDTSFIEKTVKTLKEGLQGIQTLAKPIQKVAKLVGKLFGIT